MCNDFSCSVHRLRVSQPCAHIDLPYIRFFLLSCYNNPEGKCVELGVPWRSNCVRRKHISRNVAWLFEVTAQNVVVTMLYINSTVDVGQFVFLIVSYMLF